MNPADSPQTQQPVTPTSQSPQAQDSSTQTQNINQAPPKKSPLTVLLIILILLVIVFGGVTTYVLFKDADINISVSKNAKEDASSSPTLTVTLSPNISTPTPQAALSPTTNFQPFAQADNVKRRSDINAILNAVYQYKVDHEGEIPGDISYTAEISSTSYDLCSYLVPTYLAALPSDPLTNNGKHTTQCDQDYNSGYFISYSDSENKITVSAPDAELGETIVVSR